MKNILITVALVVAIALGVGAYFYPENVQSLGNSATGTQFGTAKIAATSWSLATGSATTTSLYNNDQNDRIIQSSFVSCTGVGTSKTAYTGAGLAALIVRAATTTTAAPAIVTNTNYVANYSSVGTTTTVSYQASSTDPVLSSYGRVWPAGTYLSFYANATNTAQCIAGVNYLQS